jgi:replication factor C subunit 3/5
MRFEIPKFEDRFQFGQKQATAIPLSHQHWTQDTRHKTRNKRTNAKMLWVDKHRPKDLSQLSHHPKTTSRLQSLAADPQSLPHLLFYGPSGAGKKTRIACLLKAIYGNGAERLRLDKRTFKTSSNRSVDINMICSNYHIELNPGDAGIYDRYVVQDVIKEMAANRSLNSGGIIGSSAAAGDDKKKKGAVGYKVVVLVEVDKLSRQAQAALRRTMEKYSSTCRLILCCNNQSKVIEPVRSRCLGIRIAAPSHDDVSFKYLRLFLVGTSCAFCSFMMNTLTLHSHFVRCMYRFATPSKR